MIDVNIVDKDGSRVDHRRGVIDGRPRGPVTFVEPAYRWDSKRIPFLSDEGSRFLNVDGSFSGVADGIHNGTDSAQWSAAFTGTGDVDFSSTNSANSGTRSIRCWNMRTLDQLTFTRSTPVDTVNYDALSGWVNLSRYTAANQDINLRFQLAGTAVGVEVNLNNYIDTGLLNTWQKFTILKADLGVGTVDIDQLRVQVFYVFGSRPRFYLDDLRLEQAGGAEYRAKPSNGSVIQFRMAEVFMAGPFAGTVNNGTMPSLPYDALLNVPKLASGINFQRFSGGDARVAANYKCLGDFLDGTWDIVSSGSDGVNTWLKLRIDLIEWVTMLPRDDDRIEMTITDDLSGLLDFKAILIGRELIPSGDE